MYVLIERRDGRDPSALVADDKSLKSLEPFLSALSQCAENMPEGLLPEEVRKRRTAISNGLQGLRSLLKYWFNSPERRISASLKPYRDVILQMNSIKQQKRPRDIAARILLSTLRML